MYNSSNPAELYPNTTWEELPNDKYIRTGTTPLETGGSESFTITKANLPAEKLQVESVTAAIGNHYHYEFASVTTGATGRGNIAINNTQYACPSAWTNAYDESYVIIGTSTKATLGKTSDSGEGTTSEFAPFTENMGSETPIEINPAYITIRAWKRLS